jgi:uncharacterized protein DUF932
MAHEIFTEDGRASMFYVGGKPWHGLGTELETPPATGADAMYHAKLDWEVVKVPLYGAATTRLVPIPDAHAVVRADRWGTDTCDIFGLVGDSYTPVQNRDAFEFFDPVVKSGMATYHTAGALGRGERVWVLVEIQGHIQVSEGDTVSKYVLLSNSHDGRSSLHLKFTPVRVVCANTLTLALSSGASIRISHRPDVMQRLKAAGVQLGLHNYAVSSVPKTDETSQAEQMQKLLTDGFDSLEKTFHRMAERRLSDTAWRQYFESVFSDPVPANQDRSTRAVRARALASHLGRFGPGNQSSSVKATLWAAYNGVTDFLDHRATGLGEPSPAAAHKHLRSVWFGQAAHVKARAFRHALAVLETDKQATAYSSSAK